MPARVRGAVPRQDHGSKATASGASSRKERAIPKKIFVGNLAFSTTKDDLSAVMAEAGSVVDVFLPNDRATGRPRGFAFVEFGSESEATKAIEMFNGRDLGGRALKVNMAEDRPPRVGGGRPGGFGGPRPDWGGGGGDEFGGGFGGGGGGFRGRGQGGGPPGGGGKSKGSRRNLRAKKRSL